MDHFPGAGRRAQRAGGTGRQQRRERGGSRREQRERLAAGHVAKDAGLVLRLRLGHGLRACDELGWTDAFVILKERRA